MKIILPISFKSRRFEFSICYFGAAVTYFFYYEFWFYNLNIRKFRHCVFGNISSSGWTCKNQRSGTSDLSHAKDLYFYKNDHLDLSPTERVKNSEWRSILSFQMFTIPKSDYWSNNTTNNCILQYCSLFCHKLP